MYCVYNSGCAEDQHGEPGWVYMCFIHLWSCPESAALLRARGVLLGLEPVSGRKVNSWGLSFSPPEQAERVPGLQGGGIMLLSHVRGLGWTVVAEKAVREGAVRVLSLPGVMLHLSALQPASRAQFSFCSSECFRQGLDSRRSPTY